MTFSDAILATNTCVIIHTFHPLTQDDFLSIQDGVFEALLEQDCQEPPCVDKISIKQGAIFLVCQREEDVAILKREVPLVEIQRGQAGELLALTLQEYNNFHKINCRINTKDWGEVLDLTIVKRWLLLQNQTIRPHNFTIIGSSKREEEKDPNGFIIRMRCDSGFLKAIEALNFQLRFKLTKAFCWVQNKPAPPGTTQTTKANTSATAPVSNAEAVNREMEPEGSK